MRKCIGLLIIMGIALACASTAQAFTITFDDKRAGSVIYSYDRGIDTVFFYSFSVLSHAGSTWAATFGSKRAGVER